MVKSMTGYGRAQEVIDGIGVTVEIKSVNHRYLEFNSRVGRSYSFIEDKLKSYVQSVISRGKVDCSVVIEQVEGNRVEFELNTTLADSYYNALRLIADKYDVLDDISVSSMASNQDIFVVKKETLDEDKIWKAVSRVLIQAADAFVAMRSLEGEKLKADILSRGDYIISQVEFVEQRSPQTVEDYKQRLTQRINELLGDKTVDEQRLLTEVAIFADKVAVAEETVRLRSHIDQLRILLDGDEPVGRKLDFLVQEINREANTIGSKAQDVEIARTVINIKSEVEKIREQIQNIE